MIVGALSLSGYEANFVACTPLGCMELLNRTIGSVEGMHAVVIGRSNIVGIPMAHLLINANATVTVCHSRTKDIEAVVARADIVVAAVGRAEMVFFGLFVDDRLRQSG